MGRVDFPGEGFRAACIRELNGLIRYLGLGPCHFIGQCEWGVIALDYACAHPEAVRALVSSSTRCYSEMPMTALNRSMFPQSYAELVVLPGCGHNTYEQQPTEYLRQTIGFFKRQTGGGRPGQQT